MITIQGRHGACGRLGVVERDREKWQTPVLCPPSGRGVCVLIEISLGSLITRMGIGACAELGWGSKWLSGRRASETPHFPANLSIQRNRHQEMSCIWVLGAFVFFFCLIVVLSCFSGGQSMPPSPPPPPVRRSIYIYIIYVCVTSGLGPPCRPSSIKTHSRPAWKIGLVPRPPPAVATPGACWVRSL
jgi:hypothetical protein